MKISNKETSYHFFWAFAELKLNRKVRRNAWIPNVYLTLTSDKEFVIMGCDGALIDTWNPTFADLDTVDWNYYEPPWIFKCAWVPALKKLKEGKRMRRASWPSGDYLYIIEYPRGPIADELRYIRAASLAIGSNPAYGLSLDDLSATDWLEYDHKLTSPTDKVYRRKDIP